MKLDVGCGSNPNGDVNVDFFTGGWNKQEADQKKGEYLNPHEIPNFVIAHAEFLPFRDGSFDIAFSSHTIEHLKNPTKMLKELLCVSKHKIQVRCPHHSGSGAKRPFHINYFDEKWFNTTIRNLGYQPKTFITNYECLFTSRLLLHGPLPCPEQLVPLVEATILYRFVRKFERSLGWLRWPFEIELQVVK